MMVLRESWAHKGSMGKLENQAEKEKQAWKNKYSLICQSFQYSLCYKRQPIAHLFLF